MIPRIINGNQIRKHCFCFSSTILCCAIVFSMFYLRSFESHYGNDALRTLFNERSADIENLFRFDVLSLDGSGHYLINQNVNGIPKPKVGESLTIATHCTMSNLAYLPLLFRNWDGPVSLALYVDTLDDYTLILKAFAICNLSVINRIVFHVVRPIERSSLNDVHFMQDIELTSLFDDPISFCYKFEVLLLDLKLKKQNYHLISSYPNNLLRNVANRGINTDYVLHLDIDMLPSKDLSRMFDNLTSRLSKIGDVQRKTAFVLPLFEIDFDYFRSNLNRFPLSKPVLLSLIKENVVRPFYSSECGHCQNRTDYPKWIELKPDSALDLAYSIPWSHAYEPLFISHRLYTPSYDERFKQFGYNRMSLLCELHVDGWKFQVLNSAFILHLGFKQIDSYAFLEKKRSDMNRNRKLYNDIQKSLALKYPNSSQSCGVQPI